MAEIASADVDTTVSTPTPELAVIAAGQPAQTSFAQLLDLARTLGVPTKAEEIAAVDELVAYFGQLWEQLKTFVKQTAHGTTGARTFGDTLGAWPNKLRVRRNGQARHRGSHGRGAI